jgi:hypothetical protein
VDGAVDAVLGGEEDRPEAQAQKLTQEQIAILLRLATESVSELDVAPEDDSYAPSRPLRARLDPAAYSTPRRPRRAARG